jgi:hypothetical protein
MVVVIIQVNLFQACYLLVPLPLAEPFVPTKENVPVLAANHLSFAALTRAAAKEGFTSSKPTKHNENSQGAFIRGNYLGQE